jgi:hypothetical protein
MRDLLSRWEEMVHFRLKHIFGPCLIICLILVAGCDEGAVRSLGSKVGLRGQDVGKAATIALNELKAYESVDYHQRLNVAVLTQPQGNAANLPTIRHNRLNADEIASRIALYSQLTKVYAALQKLSDTNYPDQAGTAVSELNKSINDLQGLPNIPDAVGHAVGGLVELVVEKKQAKDIRKYNTILSTLIVAHQALWQADREKVWEPYLARCRSSYINSLNSVNPQTFDQKKLAELVKVPATAPYLVNLYKNQEATRVDNEIGAIQEKMDAVDEAFTQLIKGHNELSRQHPSYADAIAEFDRIVDILQPFFKHQSSGGQ